MVNQKTRHMVMSALLAALTTAATMVIRIPTPTLGYIHLGDSMVLICGILLGPGLGAAAAGIGSMLADLFSGFTAWAPGTFAIKALTALVGGESLPPLPEAGTSLSAAARDSVRHSR